MGGKNGQPVVGAPQPRASNSVEVPTTTGSRLSTISVIIAQLGDLRCASFSQPMVPVGESSQAREAIDPAPPIFYDLPSLIGTVGLFCNYLTNQRKLGGQYPEKWKGIVIRDTLFRLTAPMSYQLQIKSNLQYMGTMSWT
jgi:hypothetical protein